MIPPIVPSVLAVNPQFALIQKQLTTQFLNPDASTKSASTEYEPTAKKLRQHHVQAAQHDILKQKLHSLIRDDTLPPEVLDLVIIIATYVSEAPKMTLSPEAYDLMAPEVEDFHDNLDILSPILSSHIQREVDALLPLASTPPSRLTSTSTSNLVTSSKPLATTLTGRLSRLSIVRTSTLPSSITQLTITLSNLLTTHTAHLSSLIRHLELHTHGTHSRHINARATYLSSVAAGLDAKLRSLDLQRQHALYTPAVQRALSAYAGHLHDVRSGLRKREQLVKRELALYDEVGGQGLRDYAKRYAAVGREIEVVRAEIARLESEDSEKGEKTAKR